MGATSHSGLPPRSLSLPYTVKGTLTRDIKTAEKRSHNPGSLKPAGFYLSTLSGPQKRWGTKAGNQPQGLEQVHTLGAFPDGGSAHACRCTGSQRLVGRTRSQRCLPPDTHPPRTSQTPTVSVGGCHLKFSMSPVWTVISSKGPETNSGLSQTDRDSTVDISGRYANHVSGERHTSAPSGSHCSIVSSSGFDCQQQKIHSGPFTLSKIPGLLHQHCVNADPPSQGKMREVKTGGSDPASSQICDGQGSNQLHWESLHIFSGNPDCPTSLQGATKNGQCCYTIPSVSRRDSEEVLYSTFTDCRCSRGLRVMDQSSSEVQHSPNSTSNSSSGDRIRCFKHGMGSSMPQQEKRGLMVKKGSSPSHKLPGASGSFSSSEILHEGDGKPGCSSEKRQHHSPDLHQQDGRGTLTPVMLASIGDVELVPEEKHLDDGRTSPRGEEPGSRFRVQDYQGQVRLDAESSGLQQVEPGDGAPRNRSVCLPFDTSGASIFQLETRPGGNGSRCIHSGLGSETRLCQSTMVPHTTMPVTNQMPGSQGPPDHSSLEDTTMVPSHPGNAGGLSKNTSRTIRPDTESNRPEVHYESGSNSSRMAYLRDSFQSRGFSDSASKLLLSSWRTKTTSNYNSLFNKWASWCEQRDRNPFDGPIEDIVNFLAELHEKDYQYRSLNSYRSTISSVHKHVEGVPIGQHPLVSRILKGTFNEHPPQPK